MSLLPNWKALQAEASQPPSDYASQQCSANLAFFRQAMRQCWLNLSRAARSLGRIVR